MTTSELRKAKVPRTNNRTRRSTSKDAIVIYVANSLDGTSFALDPMSQRRIREAFPGVNVSTRHIYISHDNHDAFNEMIGRFEDQIAMLLTGVSAEKLAEQFSHVSFRDPNSDRELASLSVVAK